MINRLKERIKAGKLSAGWLVTMPSPNLVQTLAAAGADWLMIDMEHGPIDIAAVHALVTATAGTTCTPVVRVPGVGSYLAKPALDAGAFGIVYPMVMNAADATRAVASLRYAPRGTRGFGPFYAPARWGIGIPDYLRCADDEVLSVLLIEHIDAVRRIEEILAVQGIDVALIAPFDLSMSLGVPGQRDHPDVLAAIAVAERAILASPAALGGMALDAEEANRKRDAGYRLIVLGYDTGLIGRAAQGLLGGIRRD